MSELKKVRPAPGRRVRKPGAGDVLLPDGELVQWDSYWLRRLREGDIEVVSDAPTDGVAVENSGLASKRKESKV